MENCIFCKIIKKEIPSYKVYEDENFFAFLDIKPINLGHTLLVPKRHEENLFSLSQEILGKLGPVLQKLGKAVKEGTDADGLNLGMNNDQAAGQLIFHAHFHIIPRFKEDGFEHWPGKEGLDSQDFQTTQKKIGKTLKSN